MYLQRKLLIQMLIYYEANAFTISSSFKHFIQNLSTFQRISSSLKNRDYCFCQWSLVTLMKVSLSVHILIEKGFLTLN